MLAPTLWKSLVWVHPRNFPVFPGWLMLLFLLFKYKQTKPSPAEAATEGIKEPLTHLHLLEE